MAIKDGFYSIEYPLDNELRAVLRVSNGGRRFERLASGRWLEDPDLRLHHWLDPGSEPAVAITREQAEKLARGPLPT